MYKRQEKFGRFKKSDMVMVIHLIVLIVQIFILYYYPLYTIQETNNNYFFELLAFRDNEIQFFKCYNVSNKQIERTTKEECYGLLNNCKFTRVLGIMRNYGSDFSGAGIVIRCV